MADLLWYRVTTDAKGKPLAASVVEASGPEEARVFYVQAEDEEAAKEAGRLAWNAYMRPRMRARKAELTAAGKCVKCGKPNDRAPKDRCSACKARESGYSERRRRRARGEEVPALDRKAAVRDRRAADADLLRLSVLEEVDEQWRSKGTIGLRAWLRKEIARLSKGRAA